ncbi:hypothetical protein ABZ477_08385 [Microbacterium sp. NPDC019599]|uniref:hypothetical protein n=1 Tax=Microbacterium sp. NPDC019599 TaxID=3154690 RepID=UPI0033ED8B56
MSADRAPQPGHVRPLVALGFATAAFVALLIFGLGMLSLLLDEDVIAVPGLGQLPGIVATIAATGAFALSLWIALRRQHPPLRGAVVTAVATALAYPAGVWFGALLADEALGDAARAAGGVFLSWFEVVIALAALACSWGGIALVRTDASRPRWPWEDPFDE